jgi:hypothetical protein
MCGICSTNDGDANIYVTKNEDVMGAVGKHGRKQKTNPKIVK